MSQDQNSRRRFLKQLGLGCAHIGTTSLLSGITNLSLINAAAAANRNKFAMVQKPYRALVCVMLAGGNDSFNMLIPKDNASFKDYQESRTTIALKKRDLLDINPVNTGGRKFGLHPELSNVQSLFEQGNMAFVANCGILDRPTSINDYRSRTQLPVGLFSHPHMQGHWQTSLPTAKNKPGGWGGRLADLLHENNTNKNVSMSISLAGTNLYQRGNQILPYTIKNSQNGSSLISGSTSNAAHQILKRETLDKILNSSYQNVFKQAYKDIVQGSRGTSIQFDSAIASNQINTPFENDGLSKDLKMVARTIAARNQLEVQNQVFYITMGGFDSHKDNLASHGALMGRLDKALGSFYNALKEIGMEDNVTLFTMSDFGRKLISNGDGSDHAWGGNTMIMGGAVKGKHIYGEYPDLYIGSPIDVGGGRLLPTTSADEYFAELALWLGVSRSDLDYVLPNIGNFWDTSMGGMPIGFLS